MKNNKVKFEKRLKALKSEVTLEVNRRMNQEQLSNLHLLETIKLNEKILENKSLLNKVQPQLLSAEKPKRKEVKLESDKQNYHSHFNN